MKPTTKLLLLAAILAGSACCDTTYTLTASLSSPDCGDTGGTCGPVDFSVPRAGGTPAAVTWTFTDFMVYYTGINDMYDPLIGDPYTYTAIEGDTSAVLGLDAFNSQFISGNACEGGCRQISMGGFWLNTTIQASGTAPDVSMFVGNGNLLVGVTPFLDATWPTSSNDAVAAGFSGVYDYATLSVTYVDEPCSAVPEPRTTGFLLAALFAAAFEFWKKRRKGGSHGY